jgi:hypothetical protein
LLCQEKVKRIDVVYSDWRFAGFGVADGKAERPRKGEKLHYNRRLKVACWKIGSSWDEQVFAVQRSELLEMLDFVEALLARGWGRKELASEWKLQHVSQEPEQYRRWKSFKWHPAWSWVVWCAELRAQDEPMAQGKQYSLL